MVSPDFAPWNHPEWQEEWDALEKAPFFIAGPANYYAPYVQAAHLLTSAGLLKRTMHALADSSRFDRTPYGDEVLLAIKGAREIFPEEKAKW